MAILFDPPAADEIVQGMAVRRHGTVSEIVFARPNVHNALSLAMWRRLAYVAREEGARSGVRAILIRGGDRAFSAGADISEFLVARTGDQAAEYSAAVADALEGLQWSYRPIVAMLTGLVVGGGCEIAAACDLRIASADARLGVPVGRLGVTVGLAETTAMVGLVGPSRTKLLTLTNRLISAQEAFDIGLVDQVVPDGDLQAATFQLLKEICDAAPTAAVANKLAVNIAAYGPRDGDIERLAKLDHEIYRGAELQEGIKAFLEKRNPSWSATRSQS